MHAPRWLYAVVFALAVTPLALSAQQPATIIGRVTGDVGQPLGGVTVEIPALNIATVTRGDGAYLLNVPAARYTAGETVTLRAGTIGYRAGTETITIQPGSQTVNFTLAVDALRLDEIVVTGAGLEARAERMGTARSTVTEEQVVRASETNIVAALAAKTPNLLTTNSGGQPGTSQAIRIRGTTTLSGTGQPTFIVDGMVINNATRVGGFRGAAGSSLQGPAYANRAIDINPDDIESIEILKGPAAMSLLGASAGASGAILITTKRGRPGVTRFTLRSEAQIDRPVKYLPVQQRFTSGNWVETPTGSGILVPTATPCYANPTPGCTHNNPNWGPQIPAGTPVFDHGRALYETGRMFDQNLTMSGGTEATTFFLSLGALNHDGFVVGDSDQFERYTVRLNAGHEVRHNVRIGGNIAYAQTQGRFLDRGNSTNAIFLPAFRAPPDFDHRNYLDESFGLHRSYRFPQPRVTDLVRDRGWDNPFFVLNNHRNEQETGRVYGNVSLNWQALPWLAVNYVLGADHAADDRTEAYHPSASGGQAGGQLTRWQFTERIIDHTLTASASWTASPTLGGRVSVGQNLNEEYMRQVNVRGNTFIAPEPYKLENTVTRTLPSDREYRRRLAGHFAQAEFDIADQLFLTGRLRVDGSSTFGLDHTFAAYPGGQLAWIFTRTLNVPENLVSFGRFRLAYGQSGQEPLLYQLSDTFQGTTMFDFNPGSVMLPSLGGFGGLYSSTVRGNPDLRPERVGELDTGVDLAFFDGRADIGVTYYLSRASDVIFEVATPPSSGATSVVLNAGEIENRGWELLFNARPVQTPTFGLNVGLNWARNRNEVLSLGELAPGVPRLLTPFGVAFTGLGETMAILGHPVGAMRGTGFIRCGMSSGTIATPAASGATSLNVDQVCAGQPHGAVYIGANGFPITDPNPRVLGSSDPDWTAGLNLEAALRGVRLSAFLEHRQGGSTFNMTRGSMRQFGTHGDTDIRDHDPQPWINWLDHRKIVGNVFGPGADLPVVLGQTWFTGWTAQQDLLVEDATHTRLREVSLAYTFTQPWVTRTLGLSSIDARITGRNLFLVTDYAGYDPDINLGGAAAANRGIDWWVPPTARSFVFSVGLTR
jgi:TonB-linked SusC/RagA family outer membrane protein